jgi:hypothetical protein
MQLEIISILFASALVGTATAQVQAFGTFFTSNNFAGTANTFRGKNGECGKFFSILIIA